MTTDKSQDIDRLCITTLRTLAMDAVQKANSGHPGAPMGMAPVAYVLWDKFLRHNPADPEWPNRDRFVLSIGHASMLLYGLLHLWGYDLTLEQIKQFRQLESPCAGHPEFGLAPGIEITTGPLGQGASASVGMAIAGRWLASTFNRPDHTIVDYNVYALCGDGDMMEGVTSEAASLAGHLGLGNLIWIYDSNNITIEGNTSLTFTEDVAARFRAYDWDVHRVGDANDLRAVSGALEGVLKKRSRPALIVVDSHIAFGSPNKQDTKEAHGEPLGEEEVRATKQHYGWDPDRLFYVPEAVRAAMTAKRARGADLQAGWERRYAAYKKAHPDLASQWDLIGRRALPDGWDADIPRFEPDPKGLAGRAASGKVLNAIAAKVPWLLGGSADLAPSTKTTLAGAGDFESGSHGGRNFHFGVREHAMTAILNGMSLSKLRPYGAGFLIFSDYARPAIRLAALMEQPVIYVFTHDSIGVGEDGPTHQPVEQLPSLRAVPRLLVIRPADANEVVEAWRLIMRETKRPVALALTRQPVPTIDRSGMGAAEGLQRGGYVLQEAGGRPDVVLIGTGSEVQLCLGAAEVLAKEDVRVRVVSLPCWELFDEQDEAYRHEVLPPDVRARVAVEAASPFGWQRYVGADGAIVGQSGFGASAPAKDVMKAFGFTVEHVVQAARQQIRQAT